MNTSKDSTGGCCPPPSCSSWLPITDAPNSLAQIIVTDGSSVWVDQKLGVQGDETAGAYYFNGHEDWEDVTHWMPLPSLPNETSPSTGATETTMTKKLKSDSPLDAAARSRPSVVYVVATGNIRVAIESETPLPLEQVSLMAIERFVKMGCPPLGSIMEITECSDRADASDPHYVSTQSMLEKAGRVHIAPFCDENKQGSETPAGRSL